MIVDYSFSVAISVFQLPISSPFSEPTPPNVCEEAYPGRYQLLVPNDTNVFFSGPQERLFVYTRNGMLPGTAAGPFLKIKRMPGFEITVSLSTLANFIYSNNQYSRGPVILVTEPVNLTAGSYQVELVTKLCSEHDLDLGTINVKDQP